MDSLGRSLANIFILILPGLPRVPQFPRQQALKAIICVNIKMAKRQINDNKRAGVLVEQTETKVASTKRERTKNGQQKIWAHEKENQNKRQQGSSHTVV